MSKAQSLVDTITQHFDDETYSDLTIKCRDKTWRVHRLIICSQSKVFHAMCMTEFKEAQTSTIELDDDDPVALEIMLRFLYTGEYHEPANESEADCPRLEIQILTYNLADKYDIPDLVELVEERFKSTFSEELAPEEYFSVVLILYTLPTPNDVLKTIAVDYARVHFRDILHSLDLDLLRTTILDIPEFAFDVLQVFANVPPQASCYSCGSVKAVEALRGRCSNCRKAKKGISLTG